jgi:hypothetical protein
MLQVSHRFKMKTLIPITILLLLYFSVAQPSPDLQKDFAYRADTSEYFFMAAV